MSLLQSPPPTFSSLLPFNLPTISQNPNSPIKFPTPQFRLSSSSSQSNPNQNPISKPTQNPRKKTRLSKSKTPFQSSSESVTVEAKGEVLKQKFWEEEKVHVVEEEDLKWPVDADVGWGVRASEYFEKHPIKNVVVDGVEIDWEGELDEEWVQEITCLEWERFAFHPSPLVVLVFERYNRAADNWKLLKELEKAAKVYWSAKDRLPPRTIKIDMNIETDLAYALKVRECPQLLFLKGNQIVYREKEMRTADELVHMIAHFYYNAKRPSCVDPTAVAPF